MTKVTVAKPLILSAESKVTDNFPEGMMPRWCYFVQLLGAGASPLSPLELDCRWHLWTLKKGHPLHSWAVSISPYNMGTQGQVWHTSVCWISSAQEKCTTFCWSWHVEINWLLCWAWPVENPFRYHISTWHLPVLSSLSALVFISELLGFWATAFFQHGEPQSTFLHSFKERHGCLLSQLGATAPRSWSLNWFQGSSTNAWESEKRWPRWQRMSRLTPWVKDICQQLPLEQCYGSITPTFYSYLNMRNQLPNSFNHLYVPHHLPFKENSNN